MLPTRVAVGFLLLASLGCQRRQAETPVPDKDPAKGIPEVTPPAKPAGGFGTADVGVTCTPAAPECKEGLHCLGVQQGSNSELIFRCVLGCNDGAHCKNGQACFRLPGGKDGDNPRGYCATKGEKGGPCGTDVMIVCPIDTVCYPSDKGRCFEACDPREEKACPETQSCANFFRTADFGICVQPDAEGKCDLLTRFCSRNEFCMIPPSQQPGTQELGKCFPSCDPTQPNTCLQGKSCAAPFVDPKTGICAETVATNADCVADPKNCCTPGTHQYCVSGDLCVQETIRRPNEDPKTVFVCRRLCSGVEGCSQVPETPTCRTVEGDEQHRSVCAK